MRRAADEGLAAGSRIPGRTLSGRATDGVDWNRGDLSEAKLSVPGEGHKIYPYLLEGVEVNRVNQVWSTDITYIRMASRFVYLAAVMDWFSRFVLKVRALSVTMEVPFCIEALEKALRWGRPEIFNSDQEVAVPQ